jgi:epoxyqueuosine reductase QueG
VLDLKQILRDIAIEGGADYFGVAPVSRWEHAPEGHKPTDFMPSAKTVVVLGMKIPKGAIESNNRAYEGMRHGIFSYMIFGYNLINDVFNKLTSKMARYLEKEGVKVFLLPASTPRDEYKMEGVMSNRHAAVCAGLADMGWNGLALTPDNGPRVRWAPFIIDAELEPDPLYSGPKLCDRSQCRVCLDVCPVQALPEEESVQIQIEDKVFTYGKLKKPVCRCGVTGLAKGTPGRLQAEIPNDIESVEGWLKIASKDIVWNQMERVAAMCGRCLTQCPVGMKPYMK